MENEKKVTPKPIAKEIIAEYQAFESDENGFGRNQIRVLDMFVAACLHFMGEMSNSKIAKLCMANIKTERQYTSDNVFQSRKRHKELINPENTVKYNSHYHKAFERIVLSKSPEEVLIKVPTSLKK